MTRISRNISYAQTIGSNIQTLSTNTADTSTSVSGLLYVPDLDPSNPCTLTSYVPTNATTQANLPANDFNLIALAPWHDPECTLSYLESTRYDPIRAFIFYLPDNSSSLPPVSTDQVWELNDGGAWKSRAHFPVYAVPGAIGAQFMQALSQYSGNVTSVPNGRELIELGVYPSEFVRIYTEIGITSTTSLPSLWIFLLVVLGVLGIVLATTSITMHLLQRARREDLERRVMRGEVNLEALGIKRMIVPLAIINEMPLFIYANYYLSASPTQFQHRRCSLDSQSDLLPSSETEGSVSDPSTLYKVKETTYVSTLERDSSDSLPSFAPDLQTTCTICFDGYEPDVTIIRELPCGHIFHPDCIDTFLSESSSLCPLCKTSVFPLGFCPVRITHGMARRERALRQIRSRVTIDGGELEQNASSWNWRFAGRQEHGLSFPQSLQLPHKVRAIDEQLLANHMPASGCQQKNRRQEIARQRGDELAGEMPLTAGDRRPTWKKSLGRLFPT